MFENIYEYVLSTFRTILHLRLYENSLNLHDDDDVIQKDNAGQKCSARRETQSTYKCHCLLNMYVGTY